MFFVVACSRYELENVCGAAQRDAHVARRNAKSLLLQMLFQPMMFVFVFGRVMTTSGFMAPEYKLLLLPGIIAISMVFSGIWSVAMPLIAEFQFTKEIEDRLLAPIEIEWLAVEKIVAGMVQALVAGFVVIPLASLIMGSGWQSVLSHPLLLVALARAGVVPRGGHGPDDGLLRGTDAGGTDVLAGGDADDHVRLRLLSLERAVEVPDPAEGGADQPAGLRQRGVSQRARPELSALAGWRQPGCARRLRRAVPDRRTTPVPQESRDLKTDLRSQRRDTETQSTFSSANSSLCLGDSVGKQNTKTAAQIAAEFAIGNKGRV